MNRAEFQALADLRIAEAKALLGLPVPMPDGAYYLAGYAVECALKACIARGVNQHDWPDKQFVIDCHTHSIEVLVRMAGLVGGRKADSAKNGAFRNNWTVVKDWSEQSRYQRYSLANAMEMVNAVADPADGVLPWIKVRW